MIDDLATREVVDLIAGVETRSVARAASLRMAAE
jgi:hypothetical protein